jgi:hypothetical protein
VFSFDQLNRIRGCMQIHRVIRMALEMACEIKSIQIDSSIVWMRGQANPLLRLGILIDLDTAHEAHRFATSYFHLPMGGHGVGWPMGRLLTSPSRTHLHYNVLATYRSHNTKDT